MAEIPSSSGGTLSSGRVNMMPPSMRQATASSAPPPPIAPPNQEKKLASEIQELQDQSQLPTSGTPAIRTMRSDIERLFKTAPPSVAQMVGKPAPVSPIVKKHTRVAGLYLALGIMVILLIMIGAGVYYLRETLFTPRAPAEIPKAIPPTPFFATETSRTIEVTQNDRQLFLKLMDDSMQEFERDGTMKRILIRFSDTPDKRFTTISDFLGTYHITPPESFLKRLDARLMAFVYTTTSAGTRLGFAMHTNDPTRTLRDMLDWEPNMQIAFTPLFFGKQIAPVTTAFEDRSYRNIDWRYLKLASETDLGIGYTIFPAGNILVITTSKTLMETTINRLFDAR